MNSYSCDCINILQQATAHFYSRNTQIFEPYFVQYFGKNQLTSDSAGRCVDPFMVKLMGHSGGVCRRICDHRVWRYLNVWTTGLHLFDHCASSVGPCRNGGQYGSAQGLYWPVATGLPAGAASAQRYNKRFTVIWAKPCNESFSSLFSGLPARCPQMTGKH